MGHVSGLTFREVVDRLRRRSAGEWDALDGAMADDVVVWHAYDDAEVHLPGGARSSVAGAEMRAFVDAMPDFRRDSVFHPCQETGTITEVTRWTGTTLGGAALTNATCIVYSVAEGRIQRIEIFDDSARSRSFAELLVHVLIRRG